MVQVKFPNGPLWATFKSEEFKYVKQKGSGNGYEESKIPHRIIEFSSADIFVAYKTDGIWKSGVAAKHFVPVCTRIHGVYTVCPMVSSGILTWEEGGKTFFLRCRFISDITPHLCTFNEEMLQWEL